MKPETCQALLVLNRAFYAKFAGDFAATRRAWPPGFTRILPYLRFAANVLDVGCGNGRLLAFLRSQGWTGRYVGVDSSIGLLAEAEALALPDARFVLADLLADDWGARAVAELAALKQVDMSGAPGVTVPWGANVAEHPFGELRADAHAARGATADENVAEHSERRATARSRPSTPLHCAQEMRSGLRTRPHPSTPPGALPRLRSGCSLIFRADGHPGCAGDTAPAGENAHRNRAFRRFAPLRTQPAKASIPGRWRAIFRAGSEPADAVVCLAVLHHIPGRANRVQFLARCGRLLAADGRLILSTWQFMTSSRLRRRVLPWAVAGISEEDVEPGDHLVAWGQAAAGYRYCAFIPEDELVALAREAGLTPIARFYADGHEGNLNLYGVFSAR